MSLINHEELKRQLASGEITSLDDITEEFKNILKEVICPERREEILLGTNCNSRRVNIPFKLRQTSRIKQFQYT